MNKILNEKKEEIVLLCNKYQVSRLELFGSATSHDFDTDTSDLDFLVEFKEMQPGEHAKAYFDLQEELQNIFQRDVDLVEIRAIRNPFFLQAIELTRLLIYAAA